MSFTADTYICLDIPSLFAEQVMNIRIQQHDTYRASLPVEITLIGSSGVGVFETTQDEQAAFAILDAIAAETPPIETSFGDVLRFPKTDIFVLTLTNEQPFRALHQRIAQSPIRFQLNSFPYKPHCTLRSLSPISEQDATSLLSLHIPGTFTLDTLSVYMLDKLPMPCLHRVKLVGKSS